MRVDLLTKEYPPEVYGGAGVHVAELSAVLRHHIEVQVRAFGADRDETDTTSTALRQSWTVPTPLSAPWAPIC